MYMSLVRHLEVSGGVIRLSCRYCSSLKGKVLGIRRESQSIWERRAPLNPTHVRQLVRQGARVLIQPSNRRCYPIQEYMHAGALSREDLREASLIMGVKQVPRDELIPHKTYSFFSHTIKAQADNMPLLDAVLEKDIRLLDYEKMTDSGGRRLVAFGTYAGVAGMINILHGMGLRLLAMGHHTPFMHVGPAHNYRNSNMARQAIRDAGYDISRGKMPQSIGPLTFVFTGAGNVSKGAQSVFEELPHEYVEPKELRQAAEQGEVSKVYGCVVDREDNLVRKEGGPLDLDEYEAHPERYASYFAEAYGPYTSCIINGIYWAPGAPRLITTPDAKRLLQPSHPQLFPHRAGSPPLPHRLLAVCDISADPGGSIEFIQRCTTIDSPFELYDANQHIYSEKIDVPGVLVCSIDNMPAQLPTEATDFFGSLLLPHVPNMLLSTATNPWDSEKDLLHPVVREAVITSNGQLTEKYKYIQELRRKKVIPPKAGKDSVLVLGAGYVAGPVVDYLARDSGVSVTVASQLEREYQSLVSGHDNVCGVTVDVVDQREKLEKLVKAHSIVISLLPYSFHPDIAKICIKTKTNLVTASYLSEQMRELEKATISAGITVMNEVGLDPGIDHLLALEHLDDGRQHGASCTSFISYCGGLPAPEHSENPLRYKFSWSPRGVLFNTISAARYKLDGEVCSIPAGGSLLDQAVPMDFLPGLSLEGFPNRDSLPYLKSYGIEDARGILRGTLRYKGFCSTVKNLLSLGLINPEPHPCLQPNTSDITWKEFMATLLAKDVDISVDSLKDEMNKLLGEDETRVRDMEELGLLNTKEYLVKRGSPLDTLSYHLAGLLAFSPTERDIIVLRHIIDLRYPDNKIERSHIGLVVYGEAGGYSAMARTVGLPCAIAAKMILQGEIQESGLLRPFTRDIYQPMLTRLRQEGLVASHRLESV